jgi:RNA polymerase-binding transcription factor DksA
MLKDNMERMTEGAFREELRALLQKYKADLSAQDHYGGFPECGEDIRITITLLEVCTEGGECVRPWQEFDLGTYVDGSSMW